MMRSTSEILLDYQKLKERESETKQRDLLLKAANLFRFSTMNGATPIDKAISRVAVRSEIKNIGLSGFVNGLSGLLGKIEVFLNAVDMQENYVRQAGLVNLIIGAVSLLDSDAKNLKSHEDKHGILAHSLIQFTRFSHIASSVEAQASKYIRLLHATLDFSYWLEVKWVKRRMLQEDLLVFGNLANTLNLLIDITAIEPKGLEELRSNLFDRSCLLVKKQLDKLSVTAYGEILVEHVKKLEDVLTKTELNTATSQEQCYFAKNTALITFLMGTNQYFDKQRVLAFVNHLEREHALDLLGEHESLIMNRVIAESDNQDEKTKRVMEQILIPDEALERELVETVEGYTPSLMHFVQGLSFSHNEKENALFVNEQYKLAMKAKEGIERKALIGKSLMFIADGLLVAGALAMTASLDNDAVKPFIFNSGMLFHLGQKICPVAESDPVVTIFDLFEPLKNKRNMEKLMSAIQKEGVGHPLAVLFACGNNNVIDECLEYEYEEDDYNEDWIHSGDLLDPPKISAQTPVENDYVLSDEELGLLLDESELDEDHC